MVVRHCVGEYVKFNIYEFYLCFHRNRHMDRRCADIDSVLDSGDLGLGRGWKPGGIYESDSNDEWTPCTSDCKQENDHCTCKPAVCSEEVVSQLPKVTHGRLSNALKKIKKASNSNDKVSDNMICWLASVCQHHPLLVYSLGYAHTRLWVKYM